MTRKPTLRIIGSAALATACVLLLQVFVSDADAAANTDRLNPDERLTAGERLISPNGQYVLTMQGDGNLVEYAPGNRAIWASGTHHAGSVVRMQGDGNLVIIAPGNIPMWSTGTGGNPRSTLEVQNDGNVVVYANGHVARWSTGGSSPVGDRIVAIAGDEQRNTQRNREVGREDCNFYTGDLDVGSPCGNGGWAARAWCADFSRWVWAKAGARTDGLNGLARSFTSADYTPGAQLNGVRPGDAILYRLGDDNWNNDHVGIVVAVSSSTVTTVEGNSSDRVARLTVTRGNRDISGYARPRKT